MSDKAAKYIGSGIAIAGLAIAAAWLENNGHSNGGIWLLILLICLF